MSNQNLTFICGSSFNSCSYHVLLLSAIWSSEPWFGQQTKNVMFNYLVYTVSIHCYSTIIVLAQTIVYITSVLCDSDSKYHTWRTQQNQLTLYKVKKCIILNIVHLHYYTCRHLIWIAYTQYILSLLQCWFQCWYCLLHEGYMLSVIIILLKQYLEGIVMLPTF